MVQEYRQALLGVLDHAPPAIDLSSRLIWAARLVFAPRRVGRNEYQNAFHGRRLLLADLAMRCDIGATAPKTEIESIQQAARREVFVHIARMLELRPEDFVSIADGKDIE